MVHWDEVQRTVLSVDVRNQLGHLSFELGRVRQSGRGNLDEHNVTLPLRVFLKELLECSQL